MSAHKAQAPFIVSWNITRRCNLLCGHCYLDASELSGADQTSTEDAFRTLDQIAEAAPGCMLVLTGGEPLARQDLPEIISRASSLALFPVLGTNGTLIGPEAAEGLARAGLKGAGISLDSLSEALHDRIRGVPGAWAKAVSGIEALSAAAIPVQLQLTVFRENSGEIPAFIDFAIERGARAANFFFLVCTGRGQRSTDLSPLEYESALRLIADKALEYEGRIMVRARCAPHLARVASEAGPASPLLAGGTSGCIAGRGYLRISPEGQVTPCPYIPAGKGSPSLAHSTLKDIIERGADFASLRQPAYKGRCAECEHAERCGGCRARALATAGDLLAEDPLCAFEPTGRALPAGEPTAPAWSPEALERLDKVPSFLRPMVRKGVERYAAASGAAVITPALMASLRQRAGR